MQASRERIRSTFVATKLSQRRAICSRPSNSLIFRTNRLIGEKCKIISHQQPNHCHTAIQSHRLSNDFFRSSSWISKNNPYKKQHGFHTSNLHRCSVEGEVVGPKGKVLSRFSKVDERRAERKFPTDPYSRKRMIGMVSPSPHMVSGIQRALKGSNRETIASFAQLIEKAKWLEDHPQILFKSETSKKPPVFRQPPKINWSQPKIVKGYTAHRMPRNYSTNLRIFSEINQILPRFFPHTVTDVGAGSGSAFWAAHSVWGEAIREINAIEPSDQMQEVADSILMANLSLRQKVNWKKFLLSTQEQSDLVIASFLLSEFPNKAEKEKLLKRLWANTTLGGCLVIVESGNQKAFVENINWARDLLLGHTQWTRSESALPYEQLERAFAEDVDEFEPITLEEDDTPFADVRAQIIAPCSNHEKCPAVKNGGYCHFVQRMQLPSLILGQKIGQKQNWRDDYFSYLVVRKTAIENTKPPELWENWSTAIDQPLKRGGHVLADVCTSQGELERKIVTKANGVGVFKAYRKLAWGDQLREDLPMAPQQLIHKTKKQKILEEKAAKKLLVKQQKERVPSVTAVEIALDEPKPAQTAQKKTNKSKPPRIRDAEVVPHEKSVTEDVEEEEEEKEEIRGKKKEKPAKKTKKEKPTTKQSQKPNKESAKEAKKREANKLKQVDPKGESKPAKKTKNTAKKTTEKENPEKEKERKSKKKTKTDNFSTK